MVKANVGDTCRHGIFSHSLISVSANTSNSMGQSEYDTLPYDASMDRFEYKEYKC